MITATLAALAIFAAVALTALICWVIDRRTL